MTIASQAELHIRLRRAAFNRALAEADFTVISTLLSPDVVLVTGTDSAVICGRKAQLATWKREFADRNRVTYLRTTDLVLASTVEPVAMEQGHWQARRAGEVVASGPYAAKWRHFGNADWMLVAEIFVTLS